MRPFGARYFPVTFSTRKHGGRKVVRRTVWCLPMCMLLDESYNVVERAPTVQDLRRHVSELSCARSHEPHPPPAEVAGVIHLSPLPGGKLVECYQAGDMPYEWVRPPPLRDALLQC